MGPSNEPPQTNVYLRKVPKTRKVGRNEPCPCGSGLKFKNCHYPKARRK